MFSKQCILWMALLGTAAILGAPAGAQLRGQAPPGAGNSPPPQLAPGDIETTQSRVYTLVEKTGLGHDHGVVGLIKSGSLHLGAAQDAGEIVIDTTSFFADTDDARKYVGLAGSKDAGTQREVTDNMLGPQVLDVRTYPTAVFHIKSAQAILSRRPNAPQKFQLDGDFTLHGTTKPISLVAEAARFNGFLRLRGNFTIQQSDFGITPFTKALGAVGVADRLTIWGDIWVAN